MCEYKSNLSLITSYKHLWEETFIFWFILVTTKCQHIFIFLIFTPSPAVGLILYIARQTFSSGDQFIIIWILFVLIYYYIWILFVYEWLRCLMQSMHKEHAGPRITYVKRMMDMRYTLTWHWLIFIPIRNSSIKGGVKRPDVSIGWIFAIGFHSSFTHYLTFCWVFSPFLQM